jgi:hypothetical protein
VKGPRIKVKGQRIKVKGQRGKEKRWAHGARHTAHDAGLGLKDRRKEGGKALKWEVGMRNAE